MAVIKPYKNRTGTTAQRTSETLGSGYAAWDSDMKMLFVHDGATAGGVPCVPASRIVPSTGTAGYYLTKNEDGENVFAALPTSATVQDSRTFVLMTGIPPAKWYTPTAKTATSAVVEPSAATSGTMTIYLYSKVVGSSTTTTIATLSVPSVAAGVPTTLDFADAAISANSQIWAECADLKSGGSVSVSVVMQ